MGCGVAVFNSSIFPLCKAKCCTLFLSAARAADCSACVPMFSGAGGVGLPSANAASTAGAVGRVTAVVVLLSGNVTANAALALGADVDGAAVFLAANSGFAACCCGGGFGFGGKGASITTTVDGKAAVGVAVCGVAGGESRPISMSRPTCSAKISAAAVRFCASFKTGCARLLLSVSGQAYAFSSSAANCSAAS